MNIQKGKLIVFSAPSGSGKTTIVKNLLQKDYLKLKFSISACSRKNRPNEVHGKDYYFISKEDFKAKIKNNEFVEWEEVYENRFYGTLKSEVENIRNQGINVVFDIDVAGGISIKNMYGENVLSIFVMPPSMKELEKRLILRSTENEEELKKRLSKAEFEMSFADKFDEIIINDNLETAIKQTEKLILKLNN